jgi:hypothetical protein
MERTMSTGEWYEVSSKKTTVYTLAGTNWTIEKSGNGDFHIFDGDSYVEGFDGSRPGALVAAQTRAQYLSEGGN